MSCLMHLQCRSVMKWENLGMPLLHSLLRKITLKTWKHTLPHLDYLIQIMVGGILTISSFSLSQFLCKAGMERKAKGWELFVVFPTTIPFPGKMVVYCNMLCKGDLNLFSIQFYFFLKFFFK